MHKWLTPPLGALFVGDTGVQPVGVTGLQVQAPAPQKLRAAAFAGQAGELDGAVPGEAICGVRTGGADKEEGKEKCSRCSHRTTMRPPYSSAMHAPFTLTVPSRERVTEWIARHGEAPVTAAPDGDHDHRQADLPIDFAVARKALRSWRPFEQPWLRLVADGPPRVGQVVAVCAKVGGLWWTNLSRVIEVEDREDLFAFRYATLPMHVESGQERFSIHAGSPVRFEIEATSRPRHPLVRLGYPLARSVQRRFARGAIAAMSQIRI